MDLGKQRVGGYPHGSALSMGSSDPNIPQKHGLVNCE